jgi:hypothetical protein
MKRIFAVAVCGFVALAAGCSSTQTDASAGMVKGEKACGTACTEGKTCTDGAKAAPGMVAGEKKACGASSGCSASATSCTEKKAN